MAASASMVSPAGLGTSLSGSRLRVKPTTSAVAPRLRGGRGGVVKAKYGDKSVYFDLEDVQNTTGNWDLYGSDGPSPYNGLQSKFFETFAGPFARRRYLLRFLLLGFGGAIAFAGANASGNYVPIVKGPQGPPQPGPNGKI